MKKDVYMVSGIVALVAAIFAGGTVLYNQKSARPTTGISSQDTLRVRQEFLVNDWSPTLGPSMARVVLVEFLDPECESCRAMHPVIKGLLKEYDGRIRYVLRFMTFHANSGLAVKWLEAAREQDKFWESLDVLFEHQPEWASHRQPRPELIPDFLKSAGVDIARANKAKENPEFDKHIAQDKEDGQRSGVTGTPTYFVNGRILEEIGEMPLKMMIEEELQPH